uniref:DUF1642 domain-containing protein n=1 Tax=Lactococcus garvieae TaxID=1363 RepID=UPI00359C77B3
MKKFEEEISKMGLQILKYCEEIARLQKLLRKKNKAIRELNEAVKKNKARLKECEKLRIEANNEAASEYSRKCEVVEERAELKRENQRLRAENLSLKTLVENAKKQQPEIPEFVAKDIEEFRKYKETEGLLYYEDYMSHETLDWIIDIRNQPAFMQALSTGKYTVAKEKRFYLKNKLTGGYIAQDCYNGTRETYNLSARTEFTQQEIDSMETGSYEQIEVSE